MTGPEILAKLIEDATLVIDANHPDPTDRAKILKLLPANRHLLETYAARGRGHDHPGRKRVAFGNGIDAALEKATLILTIRVAMCRLRETTSKI